MTSSQYYIGLMSGTSMDGLDAVLVDITDGRFNLVATQTSTIPPALRAMLEQLMQPHEHEIHQLATADQLFAELSARAVNQLLRNASITAAQVTAIGSHGQTIRHQPQQATPYTLQIGDPSRLAALTGIDVVADFRRKDMALGGQGAPLVPAFHQFMFSSDACARALLNLGGIANITWLPGCADQVTGFDAGPANTLLDQWYQLQHQQDPFGFDRNGQFAAQGHCIPTLLTALLSDPFFARQPPKSTGRDDFNLAWLTARVPNIASYNPADVQQTLQHFTAQSVAQACRNFLPALPATIYVCGGGALNPDLMRVFSHYLPEVEWQSTVALGIAPEWVEAMAFAWLAWCYKHQRPGNLPAVTGATRHAVLGGLYPSG